MNEQSAVHHIKCSAISGFERIGNKQFDTAVLPSDIATGDPNGLRIEVASVDPHLQLTSFGQRCQLDGCVTSSTGKLKHAQWNRWSLKCERFKMAKQAWNTTADGIDAPQTPKRPVVLNGVQTRLIHHFGLPIARHRNQARSHLVMLKIAQS